MKNTTLTPEQIDDQNFNAWLTKCRKLELKMEKAEQNFELMKAKAEFRVLKAEGKLIRMRTEAMKTGMWLPSSRYQSTEPLRCI